MKKKHINSKEMGEAPKFYSHAVAVTGPMTLVYVSGQVALAPGGKVVGAGDMKAQAEQVFKNVGHALKAAGAGWGDVIKQTTYMVGVTPANLAAYRAVRAGVLKGRELPASTLVGVTALVHPALLLEVEVVAALS